MKRSRGGATDLSVRLGPLSLKNPIVAASGTFGYGTEFLPYLKLADLGGFVTKGLSLLPRRGNAPPRTCETPSGMLNAIGLANVGVDAFLDEKLPALRGCGTAVIANVFGETREEYVAVARRLNGAPDLQAIELNLSCPNTEKGGIAFGVSPPVIREVVGAVRRAAPGLPLIVKLTPNITDIAVAGRAARDGGADMLSLVNTFLGMAVDLRARRPVLDNAVGGLSGPAIKPLALYMVQRVYREVGLPIMGMGGISGAEDALEFMVAGSAAVQVGTANFFDPTASVRMVRDIDAWCRREGIRAVRELTGTLQFPHGAPPAPCAG
ncbi:MAG: dihydroorotate dehydrogenase B catalytic subunit [Acidobacteria bacterium 13_1_40CM_2_68_5]|nr:MAG: dihydroorotate dehydrogenase B catalytic subunit [Acidobacteria bacterium 13_1_40CM_2_68_5]